MFADDMNIFMQFDQKSWQTIMNMFMLFEQSSGLKINYDKTTVYRLGSIANSNAHFYSSRKIKGTNEPVNILGVFVSQDPAEGFDLNYQVIKQY